MLKTVIVTLNDDLVNFRKLFVSLTPDDKVTPDSFSCADYDKSKNQYEEDKSENVNKTKHIVLLEEQMAKLKVRLSGSNTGYRSGSHRGGIPVTVTDSRHRDSRDRDSHSRQRHDPPKKKEPIDWLLTFWVVEGGRIFLNLSSSDRDRCLPPRP